MDSLEDLDSQEMMVQMETPEELAPGVLRVQEDLAGPPDPQELLVRVDPPVNLVSMEPMEMMEILVPLGVMECQEAPDQV